MAKHIIPIFHLERLYRVPVNQSYTILVVGVVTGHENLIGAAELRPNLKLTIVDITKSPFIKLLTLFLREFAVPLIDKPQYRSASQMTTSKATTSISCPLVNTSLKT